MMSKISLFEDADTDEEALWYAKDILKFVYRKKRLWVKTKKYLIEKEEK
jgi:hypothetical protein